MLPFPYSPFAAAQHLFGYNDPKLLKDAKKTEFVKFMDICEHFFISHPASGQKEGLELERFFYLKRIFGDLGLKCIGQ